MSVAGERVHTCMGSWCACSSCSCGRLWWLARAGRPSLRPLINYEDILGGGGGVPCHLHCGPWLFCVYSWGGHMGYVLGMGLAALACSNGLHVAVPAGHRHVAC